MVSFSIHVQVRDDIEEIGELCNYEVLSMKQDTALEAFDNAIDAVSAFFEARRQDAATFQPTPAINQEATL